MPLTPATDPILHVRRLSDIFLSESRRQPQLRDILLDWHVHDRSC